MNTINQKELSALWFRALRERGPRGTYTRESLDDITITGEGEQGEGILWQFAAVSHPTNFKEGVEVLRKKGGKTTHHSFCPGGICPPTSSA